MINSKDVEFSIGCMGLESDPISTETHQNFPDTESPWSCIFPACQTDDPDDGWGGCNGPCS